jgi:hypothetical protein
MRMTLARRLAEGTAAWLHFKFCCNQGGAMSENYLKAVVGEILQTVPSREGARVFSDFRLDAVNIKPGGQQARRLCSRAS